MRLLAIDIESCNGDPYNASMCSFGYCLADEDFNIIEQRDILINPLPIGFDLGRHQNQQNIKLYYPEIQFRNAPKFPGVYEEISRILTDEVIVLGFAVENDVRYLNNACDIYGLDKIPFHYIDIQLLLKIIQKTRNDIALPTAAGTYNIRMLDNLLHRSDEDARLTMEIAKKYCQLKNITIKDIIGDENITTGLNAINGGRICCARDYYDVKQGMPLTKRMKAILLNEYILEMNQQEHAKRSRSRKFANRAVCFSQKIEFGDIDLIRSLISGLYALGAKYVPHVEKCDIFIYDKDAHNCHRLREITKLNSMSRKKIKTIELSEIKKILSPYMTDLEFDDRDTLFRVHSRFHVDNVEDISDVSIKNRIMDAKIAADSGNYVININWAVKTPI